MTNTRGKSQGWAPAVPAHEGIFTRSLRRDLTDLNRRYLELGLHPAAGADPMVAWSEEVRREVEAAGPAMRDRMACCPFALFEIRLPPGDSGPDTDLCAEEDRVEDRAQGGPDVARAAECVAFAHGALFIAWRLAESAPLAARIAFGLTPATERELNEMSPTRIAQLATRPGVVRARWPGRPGFWAMLRAAAQAGCAHSLQWAHCFGLCLMDGERGGARDEDVPAAENPSRR